MTYNYDINKEVQNLLVNYPNRVIRVTTDYLIVTIGRVQIENLDWRWVQDGMQLSSLMLYNPYDCMFRHGIRGNGRGNFKVTKYGLTYREKPLTLASYTPLWAPGTKPEDQAKIMAQEMIRMSKEGSKKCENGIEITPESPLWNTIDLLSTTARNTFRTLLSEKVKSLKAKNVQIDGEKLLNDGVRVTPDIIKIVRNLSAQLTK